MTNCTSYVFKIKSSELTQIEILENSPIYQFYQLTIYIVAPCVKKSHFPEITRLEFESSY